MSSVAAEDIWSKVKALKCGTGIRVFQSGSGEAVVGKIDEADIERLEARAKAPVAGSAATPALSSSSSSVSFGGKPGFELVYRKGMK